MSQQFEVTQPLPGLFTEKGLNVEAHVLHHYHKLVGRTITGVVLERCETYDPLPVLELDNGDVVSVLQDPEGNGPGHLEIHTP